VNNAAAYKLRLLSATYRRDGPRATAVRVLTWLAGRIYRREDHLILSIPSPDDLPFPVETGLEVRSLAERDIGTLRALTGNHVVKYLRGGYPAFIASLAGKPIGCFWWVDTEIDADHPDLVLHDIELGEAEAYGFYFFVAEDHRGGGVATEFLSRVLLELRQLGYSNVQGFVAANNRPARWLFSLVGFEVTRKVTIRRLFSLLALADRRLLIRNLGPRRRHSFGEHLLAAFGRW
jgi:GNAT superfamily N-acetyltransferase